MSLSNPKTAISEQDLKDFYDKIKPFLAPKTYAGFTPIGTVIQMIAESAPANYLICDGATYNVVDYPELCAHLWSLPTNSQYKVDGDATKFKVPDLRGEFLRGTGSNGHAGEGSGANVGVHQDGTFIPSMVYNPQSGVEHIQVRAQAWNEPTNIDAGIRATTTIGKISANIATSSSSLAEKYKVRPTNTSVLFCIATKNIYLDPKNDYSTEEKVIGTWISGETLYQKTIQTTLPTITTDGTVGVKLVDITDWNIDKVINVDGIVNTSNNFNLIDSCWNVSGAGSPQYFIRTNVDLSGTTKYFNIRCNRISLSESPAYVTLQYTKTTT